MEENKQEVQGLLPDPVDARDFRYADVLGASAAPIITEKEWEEGFNAFEFSNMTPITQDQGISLSCVAQSTKGYVRRLLGSKELSARFVYSQIYLPNGGAYLRDGVRVAAEVGSLDEGMMPSYQSGNAPSEEFMRTGAITPMMLTLAKKEDKFSYRMIEGSTADINIFAHAIKNFGGALGGFTGTNEGFCRPVCRAPKKGENKWGHAVDLCAFGKLDMEVDGMPQGTKCLFTKNSWGDRYAIKQGRWKGYQAIPEEYFKASEMTAVGEVAGIYAFNSWVLVPDTLLPANVKIMDFLKKNEGKLIQDVEGTGAFALIVDGKALVASKDRVAELFATYIMRKEGVPVGNDIWSQLPKANF